MPRVLDRETGQIIYTDAQGNVVPPPGGPRQVAPPRSTAPLDVPRVKTDIRQGNASAASSEASANRTIQLTPGEVEAQNLSNENTRRKLKADEDARRRAMTIFEDQQVQFLKDLHALERDVGDSWFTPGLGETGALGTFLRNVPGTAASGLASRFNSIRGQALMRTMGEIRSQSKDGSLGVGNMNPAEVEAFISSVASLEGQNGNMLSYQELIPQIARSKGLLLNSMKRSNPRKAKEVEELLKRQTQFTKSGGIPKKKRVKFLD